MSPIDHPAQLSTPATTKIPFIDEEHDVIVEQWNQMLAYISSGKGGAALEHIAEIRSFFEEHCEKEDRLFSTHFEADQCTRIPNPHNLHKVIQSNLKEIHLLLLQIQVHGEARQTAQERDTLLFVTARIICLEMNEIDQTYIALLDSSNHGN
jgi:hypothetical protein